MIDASRLNWGSGGLLPAIVQDADSGAVLMLGYMNAQALSITESSGRVTFFSRSKQRLWTKGETSGHYLQFKSAAADCDADALLILAVPHGPVCHLNTPTCWGPQPEQAAVQTLAFLPKLESILEARMRTQETGSYTARLLAAGPKRVAQKVGEEGLELALAHVGQSKDEIISEAADLVFHLLLLLKSNGLSLTQVTEELAARHVRRQGINTEP
jgi:phosphoribosyl-ATP pyrophosphohydrolase/phosphoribosyl-AMP cyclohydrolase